MPYLFLLLELEIAGEGVEDVPRGLGAVPRFFSVYENGVPTLNPHMAHGGLGKKDTAKRKTAIGLTHLGMENCRKKEAFTNMAF